jgi:hypothetical protein
MLSSQPVESGSNNHAGPFHIRRKPVASRTAQETSTQEVGIVKTTREEFVQERRFEDPKPVLPARPDVSLQTSFLPPPRVIDGPVYASPDAISASTASIASPAASGISSSSSRIETSPASSAPNPQSSAASYVQKAYREARHFVGGLIAHPTESTKHYTILRHSHGIVFYQGSYTFLAISIFADAPLPADRTLWIQSKGWTGKTGMRARALLRLNDSWLNVTPTTAIRPDQVDPSDERAWQRDIARFRKKAPHPIRERHVLRETAIVRIPVEAGDGYFQFVLCQGEKKKVLCHSPVFRVISTSSDPSSLRGASLSTLPLELGVYAASMYTQTTVQNFISPVTSTVQKVLQPYLPSSKVQYAASTAYSISGIQDRVDSTFQDANSRFEQVEGEAFVRASEVEAALEAGPVAPYPINFVARVEVVLPPDEIGSPKVRVAGIPSHIIQRLYGYYFGWSRFLPDQRSQTATGASATPQPSPWQQSIISATPALTEPTVRNVRLNQALKTKISIRFIDDIEVPLRTRIEVRIMGFIRSPESSPPTPSLSPSASSSSSSSAQKAIEAGAVDAATAAAEERILLEACDASLAQSTLDHPAWAPDAPVTVVRKGSKEKIMNDQEKTGKIFDRTKDTYAQMRVSGQRVVDRVPLHRFGVRVGTDQLKDKTVAVSGLYIPR